MSMTNRRLYVLVLIMTSLCSAAAQEAASLSFEVATIRDSDPSSPTPPAIRYVSNRLEVSNMTLQQLIAIAYDLNFASEQQVIGGPSWLKSERFDVRAEEDEAVSKRIHDLPVGEQGDANRQLIRALLTERFGLKARTEQRILTTYTLETSKGGPRLPHGVLDPKLPSNIPQSRVNVMGVGVLEAHNTNMALFAKVLGSQPELYGRTVVDRTGLKGNYDFTLKWTPAALASDENADPSPSLFSALQEQLGLKMKSAKNLVNVVVVDSVEKPSAN